MTGIEYTQSVCGICLSEFIEPKLLPCFHTFCAQCLESNIKANGNSDRFSCPTCRALTVIPNGGVLGFQTNFYVTSGENRKSDFDCDACGKSKIATYTCKECDQMFCESCRRVHLRMTSSRGHEVSPLNSIEINRPLKSNTGASCLGHRDTELTSFCNTCTDLVCRKCIEDYHSNHSKLSIATKASEARQAFKDLIETSVGNLTETANDTRVMTRQFEAKFKHVCKEVETMAKEKDALIHKINETFEKFKTDIQSLNFDQKRASGELIENQAARIRIMQQTIDQSKELSDTIDDVYFLQHCDELIKELSDTQVTLTPGIAGDMLMGNIEKCLSWIVRLKEEACKT